MKEGKKNFCFYFVIPIVLLILFSFIMHSDVFLKRAWGEEDDLIKELNLLAQDVQQGHLEEARAQVKEVHKAWEIIKIRILLSASADETGEMDQALARLTGYLLVYDRGSVMGEIHLAKEIWHGLGD